MLAVVWHAFVSLVCFTRHNGHFQVFDPSNLFVMTLGASPHPANKVFSCSRISLRRVFLPHFCVPRKIIFVPILCVCRQEQGDGYASLASLSLLNPVLLKDAPRQEEGSERVWRQDIRQRFSYLRYVINTSDTAIHTHDVVISQHPKSRHETPPDSLYQSASSFRPLCHLLGASTVKSFHARG